MSKHTRFSLVFAVAGFVCIVGCGTTDSDVADETRSSTGLEQNDVEVDAQFACTMDQDCEVKNVGSCCGYYPRCVNVDHEPNLAAVLQHCRESELASVCAFPSITHCECQENKCRSVQ